MESEENRFETAIWPLGSSQATTIPPRILMLTQAPDADDAEVRWRYDDDRPPRLYLEFGRASDEGVHHTYAHRTKIQSRSQGSRATAIPVDVLREEDALDADSVVWTFDLRDQHPVRLEFQSTEEVGDTE